ncbi:MAG: serine dehydratase subunit alpha family protein [Dorea sp.]|nr:serine dehydratase subunit alpha family protein [Dorea sp.]
MDRLTELIKKDMKPALGVTEPGAIAFAVATAREYAEGEILKVRVALNSGMYKNAFTCGIPNSDKFGNLYAAALGAVAAEAGLGLESLANITERDNERAAELVEDGRVEVAMDHVGSQITIDAVVVTEKDEVIVHIRDSHTGIVSIEKNKETIYLADASGGNGSKTEEIPLIHQYTLHELLEYAKQVPERDISFIREAFSMNMELLEEGMHSQRAVITKQLLKENNNQIISEDALRTAQLLCSGAIEARVLGLNRPAMSITGSGAHGIIATMPLFAYFQVNYGEIGDVLLLRAAALSYLITMYIKEYSGKLSAFCGCGIAAGCGMACGLAFLRGANESQIDMVIRNMASGLTGMICDGGNHGCAMKGIVSVDAAYRAVELAMQGIGIGKMHGINGRTPEDTMRYMGMIASPGMVKTEETIVDIMQQK